MIHARAVAQTRADTCSHAGAADVLTHAAEAPATAASTSAVFILMPASQNTTMSGEAEKQMSAEATPHECSGVPKRRFFTADTVRLSLLCKQETQVWCSLVVCGTCGNARHAQQRLAGSTESVQIKN